MGKLIKRFIILGAPGVGKGTQAKRLASHFGWVHISTGDMLREAIHEGSELGERVSSFVEKGDLVPDDLMGELISQRVTRADCRNGFILDGFPRTITQAEQLDLVMEGQDIILDGVLFIEVEDDEIIRRLSRRFLCGECGSIVIADNENQHCPECGGTITRRPDDDPETIRHRLSVYRRKTEPLVEYYRQQDMLFEIDGSGSVDEIFQRILYVMDEIKERV